MDKGLPATMRLGPHDLLEYNARYSVLICRDCHYAMQKNALGSHLLRHKSYREERQRLLSIINDLDIVEPDDLPLPAADTPPVPGLPVVPGYCCTVAGCGYLCASAKRMKRHLSDVHCVNDEFLSLARSAQLQTFFRGTKLKYFEVSAISSNAESQLLNNESGQGTEGLQLNAAPSPAQSVPNPEAFPAVDLETLTYFHHFITTASVSLPGADDSVSWSQYWEKEVLALALQRRWLMCGLLAISAHHSATFEDEITARKTHCERATKFYSEFRSGFKETNDKTNRMANKAFQKANKAGIRIRSILNCAQRNMNQKNNLGSMILPQLESILLDIRTFASPKSATSPCVYQSRDKTLYTVLEKSGPPENDNTRTTLLNHIDLLPYRMAEIFGKPDHEQDAPEILLAIEALWKCCLGSFEFDNLSGAWECMAGWLIQTTDHFNRLLSLRNSAALVVLAYWAAILVQRAESCGIWLIQGLSRRILLQIREHLAADDAAWGLVVKLIGSS